MNVVTVGFRQEHEKPFVSWHSRCQWKMSQHKRVFYWMWKRMDILHGKSQIGARGWHWPEK